MMNNNNTKVRISFPVLLLVMSAAAALGLGLGPMICNQNLTGTRSFTFAMGGSWGFQQFFYLFK